MISLRAATRGWGVNVSPRAGFEIAQAAATADGDETSDETADETSATDEPAGDTLVESRPTFGERLPDEHDPYINKWSTGRGAPADRPPHADAPGSPWRIHPIGIVAGAALVIALAYHTVLDTEFLIGNLEPWHWVALVVLVGLALWPVGLHGVRIALDAVSSVTKRISMTLAWVVFFVQFFNVVTRYGTRYVEQDILIGQATSLAWQSFAALFLIGANYGIRDGVNPRIDFWWANFSDRAKAWLDFVLHAVLFLPFVFMAIRILQPYTAISLGRKRDGTWPSGYKVWETWEQSSDADQLPVGPVKTLLLVGFVLVGIQVISELIKTGFIMANRREYGDLKTSDVPQRIE